MRRRCVCVCVCVCVCCLFVCLLFCCCLRFVCSFIRLFVCCFVVRSLVVRVLFVHPLPSLWQVQHTAAKLLSKNASLHRANTALNVCGSLDHYLGLLDHIVVLFLSRMGVDQSSRQAISALSDLFMSRMSMFAEAVVCETQANSARSMEEIFTDALSVFGVSNPTELISWYDVNVVQYAEQMLTSEVTLKQRIVQVESERQKRQDVLTQFLSTHATEGTELYMVHREMNNAQQQMVIAQRAYYEVWCLFCFVCCFCIVFVYVCLFVCSFVCSFVRLFVCFVRLFVCSFVRLFVRIACLFVLFVFQLIFPFSKPETGQRQEPSDNAGCFSAIRKSTRAVQETRQIHSGIDCCLFVVCCLLFLFVCLFVCLLLIVIGRMRKLNMKRNNRDDRLG
jgi:hypothetical protein